MSAASPPFQQHPGDYRHDRGDHPALRMVKPFMNGEEVTWNERQLELPWVRPELPKIAMHVAGYGPKTLAVAGRGGDGIII